MKAGLLQETFELVKSLTPAEKRYFKLHAGFQQGAKNYLQLFDILDAQKAYDEKETARKFGALKSKKANFPAVKKYLFNQLIASLKSFGAYKDLDSDHTDLIETYKVLHYKGLYGQSGRLLKKIKAVTLEDDAFLRHFYVLLLEYGREVYNPDEAAGEAVHRVLEEKAHTLRVIQNYTTVGDAFTYQRLLLRKKLFCRTDAEAAELTAFMQPVLDTREEDMLSRTARAMRTMALCDYYAAIGEPRRALALYRTHLQLRKSAGPDKTDNTSISEHIQHLWLCLRAGVYDGLEDELRRFRETFGALHNQQKFTMGYERWYPYALIYCYRTGQPELAQRFILEEAETLAKVRDDFSLKSRIMLDYFSAMHAYTLQDYDAALHHIQQLLNEAGEEVEEYAFARLLEMFIHYDLKNYDLLAYQARAVGRLLKKTGRLYGCEKAVLAFFKQAANTQAAHVQRKALASFGHTVTALFASPREAGFAFYFDIGRWIAERSQRRSATAAK